MGCDAEIIAIEPCSRWIVPALGYPEEHDAACRRCAGIEMMPWSERLFYAQDPFGSRICFVDERILFTGQRETV